MWTAHPVEKPWGGGGGGGFAFTYMPSATHSSRHLSIQGFQETVKDKIAEWQGEISLSAGISNNDMQLRYENARRKSLAKMAAKLIENQKKVKE